MLLSVAVATPPSSAPAAERSCAEVIEGRVLDAATAEAIAEVTVELERPHQSALRTTTDDDGAFEISGLCPGSYRLRVSRADYEGAGRSVKAGSKPIAMTLEPHNVDVLDDVIVTAPAPQRLDAATRGSTIDGEDLDAVRGQSLADALASVPGVTVLRTPAGGLGKPIIRGHVGRRNLILYDGVRHESQKWGIDHAPEIDPFAADSISVLKGAGGIRYGPDAIGGVVLIDPPPLPTSPDTGSSVTGETHLIGVSNGLRGTTATRLQGAHAKLPGFAWRLEGNASRGAALIAPDYPLDNTGSQIWNGGASLGYARRGFSIEGTYRHHDMKAGIFTGTLNDNPDQFEQALALRRPQSADLYNREYEIERPFQTVTHQLGLLRGRAPLGRFGDLVATYAVQVDDRDEFEIVRDNVSGPQRSFDLTTHAGELVFEHAPVTLGTTAYLEGSFGGGYTFRRNRYDGSDPAFLPDYRGHQAGVYALERLVFERVELEGGARYDGLSRRSVLNDKAYAPARVQGRLPNDCRETEDDGAVCYTPFQTGSGSLGVLFRPVATAREFFVRLDASTAVRFPTVDEQFMKGTTPSFPVFVNGDGSLGPERTWGGALTVGHATPWLFVEGSAYANYIDDYIYFRARPLSEEESQCAPLSCGTKGAFPLFEPGAVDALFYGGEVTGEVQPPKWPVSFDAQASWVRAFQLPGGEPLVFIPPDRYRLGITYHWPDIPGTDNGHVGVSGTFVDRQRRFDPDADFADPPPAYGLLGAEIGLDVPFSGQVFSAAVTGRNL
ncbi:MAG: TonB-dependent receptor, partial [Myxococcota bacterium]